MEDPILAEFIKCNRNIPNIRINSDSKQYWDEVFEELERDVLTPPHQRLSVLKTMFDSVTLERILKIINSDADIENDIKDDLNDELNLYNEMANLSSAERKKSLHIAAIFRKKTDFRKKLIKEIDKKKHNNNMYMNYLILPRDMAQKWRPKPPQNFTGMSLSEKCDAITRRIATDFMHWLKELGGDEASSLDVATILDLFEIGYKSHATDSLAVKVKELPVVTKSIADSLGMPEYSHKSRMRSHIIRDSHAIRSNTKSFAFGRTLPTDMRSCPQQENIAADWMKTKKPPEHIADMSIVFEGIENMRTTKGYCEWLESNPNVKPPPYLLKTKLVKKPNLFDKSRSNSNALNSNI